MVCVGVLSMGQLTECSEVDREVDRKKGLVIPCMIYYMQNITSPRCRQHLARFEPLIFSNYSLVYQFISHCKSDIQTQRCGRITSTDDQVHFTFIFDS